MSVQTKNAELQRQMRARTAERRSGRPVRVPPDKDKLARWQGDHAGMLARLQKVYGELWLCLDMDEPKVAAPLRPTVGALIREAVEHFGDMP